jgi:phosphodiesterase/alkaline phosphatase D-like protein
MAPGGRVSLAAVQRGLIALIAGMAVGFGAAAPAMASDTLAATGNATSITADSADLNGVVYRDRVGARWLFEYSTSAQFNSAVLTTTPVAIHGRLTAVERKVSGLVADTTYYWRVVLVVRSGTHTAQTFGQTQTLQTAALPATTAPATTSSSTTTAPAS